MSKTVSFVPIHQTMQVATQSDLLQALLAQDLKVLMACKGKGLCATCHVRVIDGMDKLTPRTERENRRLGHITGADVRSRLACQCRVLGDGVVVEVPEGMFIERVEDLMNLVGTRAVMDILHPINGSVLIAKGKIITRGRLEQLASLNVEIENLNHQ